MLLVFQMPDTNNHKGWKPTEQFRIPLRNSQQLWAFSKAWKSTFLSWGQILQTSVDLHKSQFFWITHQVIYCKTRLSSVMKRREWDCSLMLADLWRVGAQDRHTDKDNRQANWHLNRGRDREETGHHSRLPVPKKQQQQQPTSRASSRLCPISSHLTWLVFISRFWQPLCLFLFFCNFYLGQRLLSCHVSPAVCTVYPGCHHRAWRRYMSGRSWTREEEEVIHKVCPSRGSRQIEASIYKLSLSILVLSSINNIFMGNTYMVDTLNRDF